MSRILEASCNVSGQVTVDGKLVSNAVVLSEGRKASTGVVLLDGEKATYVTSSAQDVRAVIVAVADMMTQVISALSAHDGALGGAAAAAIAQLTTLKAQFTLTKDQLK